MKTSKLKLPANLAGYRVTKTRTEILALLKNSQPISAVELKARLDRRQIMVNKTTVYRELDFLLAKKIISEVIFQDGIKRYELVPEEHGHHVICLSCHQVKRIPLANDLSGQEKKISRQLNFKILNHSLEFYGLCQDCQG